MLPALLSRMCSRAPDQRRLTAALPSIFMRGAPGLKALIAACLTALDKRLVAAHDPLALPADPGSPPPPSLAEGGSSRGVRCQREWVVCSIQVDVERRHVCDDGRLLAGGAPARLGCC